MNEMTKRERFEAALAGGEVDHLPSAAWLHFANEHLSGEETADLQVRFMRFYGWDFCKVMNDYRYPFPTEVPALGSVDDMKRFEPMPMTERSYAEQLKCIRRLRAELGPDIPLMETLFDPMQQILRRVGYRRIEFICAHPEHALPMLEAVTKTLEHYFARGEGGRRGRIVLLRQRRDLSTRQTGRRRRNFPYLPQAIRPQNTQSRRGHAPHPPCPRPQQRLRPPA